MKSVENLLKYPLAPVCLALGYSDGAIRETRNLNLQDTAMYDLVTVDKTNLRGQNALNTHFLNLATVVGTQLKDCFTVRELAWQIFHLARDKVSGIYFVSDTCQ